MKDKEQLNESYNTTLEQVQRELPRNDRTLSKIIHNNFIEKISEIIGNTIARPNTILFGSLIAFTLTLITYITAKTFGYTLSGFETIASFIIGWVIGFIYDYLKIMITGKK